MISTGEINNMLTLFGISKDTLLDNFDTALPLLENSKHLVSVAGIPPEMWDGVIQGIKAEVEQQKKERQERQEHQTSVNEKVETTEEPIDLNDILETLFAQKKTTVPTTSSIPRANTTADGESKPATINPTTPPPTTTSKTTTAEAQLEDLLGGVMADILFPPKPKPSTKSQAKSKIPTFTSMRPCCPVVPTATPKTQPAPVNKSIELFTFLNDFYRNVYLGKTEMASFLDKDISVVIYEEDKIKWSLKGLDKVAKFYDDIYLKMNKVNDFELLNESSKFIDVDEDRSEGNDFMERNHTYNTVVLNTDTMKWTQSQIEQFDKIEITKVNGSYKIVEIKVRQTKVTDLKTVSDY